MCSFSIDKVDAPASHVSVRERQGSLHLSQGGLGADKTEEGGRKRKKKKRSVREKERA